MTHLNRSAYTRSLSADGWKRNPHMNVREWMNNNSALVTIGAVVLLVIALGIILLQTGDGITSGPIMMYYYDLNEGRLIQVMSDQPAPVETASGPHDGMPAGVRAHVYTCG